MNGFILQIYPNIAFLYNPKFAAAEGQLHDVREAGRKDIQQKLDVLAKEARPAGRMALFTGRVA